MSKIHAIRYVHQSFKDMDLRRAKALVEAIEEQLAIDVGPAVQPEPVETLRDRFAAAALTGLLAGRTVFASEAAKRAYGLADAMLAAREVQP